MAQEDRVYTTMARQLQGISTERIGSSMVIGLAACFGEKGKKDGPGDDCWCCC